MSKQKTYWAGYCDGKVHIDSTPAINCAYAGNVAVFTNKRIARRFFSDVRKVIIKEVKK